jgi:secondary thiamine-phosphate synthase enzyme
MIVQHNLSVSTRGRGTYGITAEIEQAVRRSGIRTGICHCFIQHTSASLILCENADPMVRRDLESFLARLVPDGDRLFEHTDEGPDDMPAHVRAILTKMDLTLPIRDGRCALGTWQGVYLYEHRTHPHHRQVILTLMGEPG